MWYWKTIVVIFIFIMSVPVHAYNVYKCKDKNGNVVFSQTLCPDTKSEFVQVEPATGKDEPSRHNKSLIERANDKYLRKNNSSTKKSRVLNSSQSSKRDNSVLCSKYKNKVKNTQADMRSGYTSKHGEYLRSRLREEKKKLDKYCK